jgi:hypothetical protein
LSLVQNRQACPVSVCWQPTEFVTFSDFVTNGFVADNTWTITVGEQIALMITGLIALHFGLAGTWYHVGMSFQYGGGM